MGLSATPDGYEPGPEGVARVCCPVIVPKLIILNKLYYRVVPMCLTGLVPPVPGEPGHPWPIF